MAHPSLFIDALQYNNWSEEVFKQRIHDLPQQQERLQHPLRLLQRPERLRRGGEHDQSPDGSRARLRAATAYYSKAEGKASSLEQRVDHRHLKCQHPEPRQSGAGHRRLREHIS